MLILKIKEKGLYLDIPGASPVRTPAEIDITKCDLSVVSAHLRMNGISDYIIFTKNSIKQKSVDFLTPSPKKDTTPKHKNTIDVNDRFLRLERMMQQLLEKELEDKSLKKEQITDKLNKLEKISNAILEKSGKVIKTTETKEIKKSEPEIEEIDEKFIPDIDISNLKMKSTSKETVKQDSDLDDSADLLSKIIGQEE